MSIARKIEAVEIGGTIEVQHSTDGRLSLTKLNRNGEFRQNDGYRWSQTQVFMALLCESEGRPYPRV